MRSQLALLALITVSAVAHAQSQTINFSLQDQAVGTEVYELKPDGSYSSTSKISVTGNKIESTLKGKLIAGKFESYTLNMNASGAEFAVSVAKGKQTATRAGKKVAENVPLEAYELTFANYHPSALIGLGLQVSNTQAKDYKVFDVSGLPFQASVKILETKTVQESSGPQKIRFYEFKIRGLALKYALNEAGQVVGLDVPAQKFTATDARFKNLFADPLAKFPELSQPQFEVEPAKDGVITLRDGVKLAHTVLKPKGDGPFPTILMRTPYGRKTLFGDFWAKRGYAVVMQDVRGREASEGTFAPLENEVRDGYDTLDWIANQPWSNKKVGMIGASYGGYVQWGAAQSKHPALKCIIPQVSPPDVTENIPYEFGTFQLWGNLWWLRIVKDKTSDLALTKPFKNPDGLLTLPLSKLDQSVLGETLPAFQTWLKRENGTSWKGIDTIGNVGSTKIPALHISGWWDGDEIGTALNWQRRNEAGNGNQWLIYGPWVHAFNTTSKLGDVDYGPGAILELDSTYLRFFDTYLKNKKVNWYRIPKAKVFVTGINKWRNMPDWPAPKDASATLFLTGKGELANTSSDSKPLTFTFDPSKVKVPAALKSGLDMAGGTTVIDQASLKEGLVYRGEVAKKTFAIGGPIEANLWFKSSAKDTDFYCLLADQSPDGKVRAIGQPGKIRASFIGGVGTKIPLTPNRVYNAKVRIWDTAHAILPGHRLVLLVTSSQFPQTDRNLGTGEPIANATRMVVQKNTLFHDRAHPSTLRLRLLDLGVGF